MIPESEFRPRCYKGDSRKPVIDDDLKKRMEKHPEINWSEVTRQAIQEKIETLDVMDELTSKSDLTESDVAEIA